MTPHHNALADEWAVAALGGVSNSDPEALRTCTETYLIALHGSASWCKLHAEHNSVQNEELYDEFFVDDNRCKDVLIAALNPHRLYCDAQRTIVMYLGHLIFNSVPLYIQQITPVWEKELLRDLMNDQTYRRYDLFAAFYREIGGVAGYNSCLFQSFESLRSLYNWLLVIDECWKQNTGGYYKTSINIDAMRDEDIVIENEADNNWLHTEVLPKLHAMLPDLGDPDYSGYDDDNPEWRGYNRSYGSGDSLPIPVIKLRILLAILSARLNAPTGIEGYVLPWRASRARVGLFTLRFCVKLNTIKLRAIASVQERYAPVYVLSDPATKLPIFSQAPNHVLEDLRNDKLCDFVE